MFVKCLEHMKPSVKANIIMQCQLAHRPLKAAGNEGVHNTAHYLLYTENKLALGEHDQETYLTTLLSIPYSVLTYFIVKLV